MLRIARAVLALTLLAGPAFGFCGFYVAKADTQLFNKASKVVLVRDGDRTVLTMANDFKGDPKEFAIVIPVPTFLEREQIHVGERAVVDHLDAYTAPRLVEYFDYDPCVAYPVEEGIVFGIPDAPAVGARGPDSLGVTIEAQYTVGEYDILILSAQESSGLETWLRQNGYRVPAGAADVLGSYLRQNMRFFVAKVNLKEQSRLGFTYLRPLQVAYESPKFMLPIRLGTVNADGAQELFVFALTRTGRVETTNYRTVRLPSGMELPEQVQERFADFYRDMFARQVEEQDQHAVFLEYAWDMNWCDPCAADPLSADELRQLGVFWIGESDGQARDAFVSRLHVRYTAATFPEDLLFQATADRENFQGRYVIRHPWKGEAQCDAARDYYTGLRRRLDQEAETLASLTGWNVDEIKARIEMPPEPKPGEPWWKKLWGSGN